MWPATLGLLARGFPRAERARSNAYWMLCLPVAVVVSSPISGWMLDRWGWRVMLVAEGLLPIVWLAIWLWMIADRPRQARWISSDERDHLETTLERESRELDTRGRAPFISTLLRPSVLLMVAVYFLLNVGNYGYLFWLPSALQSVEKLSGLLTGILFAIPSLLTAVGMVLLSRHSDKLRERRGHVAAGLGGAGVFLLAGVVMSGPLPLLSFIAIAVVGAGSYGALGPFWAIPTETLSPRVAGSAMGLINAVGNLGGYFGPLVVGYINQRTGDFMYAFGILSIGYLVGGALTLLLRKSATVRLEPRINPY